MISVVDVSSVNVMMNDDDMGEGTIANDIWGSVVIDVEVYIQALFVPFLQQLRSHDQQSIRVYPLLITLHNSIWFYLS